MLLWATQLQLSRPGKAVALWLLVLAIAVPACAQEPWRLSDLEKREILENLISNAGLDMITARKLADREIRIAELRRRVRINNSQREAVLNELIDEVAEGAGAPGFRESVFVYNKIYYAASLSTEPYRQQFVDFHAGRVIEVIENHRQAIMEVGGRDVVRVIAQQCSSKRCEDFIVHELENSPNDHMLGALYLFLHRSRSWHKNSRIFDALVSFYEKQQGVATTVLAAMLSVDADRAQSYLLKAIEGAQDKRLYGRLASGVHQHGNREAFKALMARMPEFGRPSWAKQEQFVEYLDASSDDEIPEVLEVMQIVPDFVPYKYLKRQMESRDPAHRRVALGILFHKVKMSRLPEVGDLETRFALYEGRESDPKAQELLRRIRQHINPK